MQSSPICRRKFIPWLNEADDGGETEPDRTKAFFLMSRQQARIAMINGETARLAVRSLREAAAVFTLTRRASEGGSADMSGDCFVSEKPGPRLRVGLG